MDDKLLISSITASQKCPYDSYERGISILYKFPVFRTYYNGFVEYFVISD